MFRGDFPGLHFIRCQDLDVVNDLIQNDFFFLVLVSAVLLGSGLGLIFKFKGTTGGSDIPAAIFLKKFGISPGKSIIMIDFVVIVTAGLIFHFKGLQIEKPLLTLMLYAFLLLFSGSFIIDLIINGFDYARQALIITDKPNQVADAISRVLSRGATAIKARGIYRDVDTEIVMTVVTIKQVPLLNEIVKQTDPNAFMITNNIHEVTGSGFRPRL